MDIPYASPFPHTGDLAPVVDRKWGASSIFNAWTSGVKSPWSDYLAASSFLLCGGLLDLIVAAGTGVGLKGIEPQFGNLLPTPVRHSA